MIFVLSVIIFVELLLSITFPLIVIISPIKQGDLKFRDFSEPVWQYHIYIRGSSAYDDGAWTEDILGASINIYVPNKPPVNIPPLFKDLLEDKYLNYSTKNNKAKETLGFNFPEFYDPENKTVTIEIE